MTNRSCRESSALGIEYGRDPGLRVVSMNLHELGCLCIRNGYEHPRLVVNTTPTVAADIPNCLNVDDGAVALDEGALHIDYASERQVGDGRNKDVHTSWAQAHGGPVAMASRTKPETAIRENRACICDLQQRS